jgi:hypothetical protein
MDDSLIKAGTENFTLPHDVVSLPSGVIFYKYKKPREYIKRKGKKFFY